MEFLIYDHECPSNNGDRFWETVPWVCTVLSIYITVNFLSKLIDDSFESQISEMILKIAALENENDDLVNQRDELIVKGNDLKKEAEHMDGVLKALVKKFVDDDHPLTKVD
jgi:hypothetical protein